jgi:hypothetical protein
MNTNGSAWRSARRRLLARVTALAAEQRAKPDPETQALYRGAIAALHAFEGQHPRPRIDVAGLVHRPRARISLPKIRAPPKAAGSNETSF